MTDRTRAWRVQKLGARWQFAFFHGVLALGGRRIAYLLADLVTLHYVLARRAVRDRCRPYLSRRFPDRTGWRRLLDTHRLTRAFARSLVDQAALRVRGAGGLRTSFAGLETLRGLLAEGKGLVLVTAHAGAWQLGIRNLGKLDRPIGILLRREAPDGAPAPPPPADDGPDIAYIDPGGHLGGVPELTGLLLEGGVVCIMGDRQLGGPRSAVEAFFLGGAVALPVSPYRLASATGAPVAVLIPVRQGPHHYEMFLADVFRVPPGLGRDPGAYGPYAQRFADALAAFADRFPYHFFNFFDLWEAPQAPHPGDPQ